MTVTFQELLNKYADRLRESTVGPGQPEAQISQPVAGLIEDFSTELMGTVATIHREVPFDDGLVRPDFGVRVKHLITGHVELKAPETSLDPDTYGKTTHNGVQWQRLKNIPNLLHTNGKEWRLWRYGEMVTESPARFHTADIKKHRGYADFTSNFEGMLRAFLTWEPSPIYTVNKLITTIAPLASLLREDVLAALKDERKRQKRSERPFLSPFLGLKDDWQAMLYPRSTDEEFADGFAQTVVFSLVIALSEGQDLSGKNIADIAQELRATTLSSGDHWISSQNTSNIRRQRRRLKRSLAHFQQRSGSESRRGDRTSTCTYTSTSSPSTTHNGEKTLVRTTLPSKSSMGW